MSLNRIAEKSDLMNIDIMYNGKRVRFNLFEELQVKETNINTELKKHASSYSFLTQLLVHLEKQTSILESESKAAWSKVFVQLKKVKGDNGRPLNDDVAKARADKHPIYMKALKKSIEIKFQKNLIARAVQSFETRKDLIQSLSANLRQENK
jgi:hypothetical protein